MVAGRRQRTRPVRPSQGRSPVLRIVDERAFLSFCIFLVLPARPSSRRSPPIDKMAAPAAESRGVRGVRQPTASARVYGCSGIAATIFILRRTVSRRGEARISSISFCVRRVVPVFLSPFRVVFLGGEESALFCRAEWFGPDAICRLQRSGRLRWSEVRTKGCFFSCLLCELIGVD